MNKFIIPFYYTLHTRIKGKSKRIAYIFTFILPIYIYIVLFNNRFTLVDFIGSVIAFIGLMSVYEIGYINNDVITIKYEKNPTLRLTKAEILYARDNIVKIRAIKYLIALIAVIILNFIGLNAKYYVIGLILIEIVYIMHNKVRDKRSIITFFFLSLLRYVTVPLIFCSLDSIYSSGDLNVINLIILFTLVIALPRTIEKAAEKKYKINSLKIVKAKTTEFRVIYYICSSIVGVILIKLGYSFLIVSLYYLCYRALILLGFYMKGRKRA